MRRASIASLAACACACAGVTVGVTIGMLLLGQVGQVWFVLHLLTYALAVWVTYELARWTVEWRWRQQR